MRKRSYVLIIFLIFFILVSITIASFFMVQFAKAPTIKSHSALEMRLFGEIQEKTAPDLLSLLYLKPESLSMYDIWTNLRKAKVDQRINTVILRLGNLVCDWAKAKEIRDLILEFRSSGKKAYAYIEEAIEFDKEYYLATACDEIVMHPQGFLIINGIGGYVPFLKQALDKLGVEAEVEHVEQYKTAYHMFTQDSLTDAHREMLDSLYSSLFEEYTSTVSEARGLPEEEVKRLIDHGFFQGEDAHQAGLVDARLYEDQFLERVMGDRNSIRRISHQQYLRISPSSLGLNRGRKIALIYGQGPIITGDGMYGLMGSATVARWIRRARQDKSIAAIVFRVDSPGGSAVASDAIWREVVLAKKEKPFIVSMSDMAGSGGYQVAMAAHRIVAQPQTLTGSIGVIFAKINLQKLYSQLGITGERIIYGKRADMFSSFRRATPEERDLLKREIRKTYDYFITKAAEGRKLSKDDIDRIGKGRVWTGSQALELGLVDEMGGLSRAIAIAKELAGIPDRDEVRLEVLPRKISLWNMVMGRQSVRLDAKLPPLADKIIATLSLLDRNVPWALMPFWLPTD
jgi:protease-4